MPNRKSSLILDLSLTILLILLLHHQAYAYCIYNKLEDGTTFYIHQTGGYGRHRSMLSRFEHFNIVPSDKKCCPYDRKDCSDEADKNYPVKFWMHHNLNGITNQGYEITCPAGGYIIFGGTYRSPTFNVFYADNQPYNYQITHAYRNKFTFAKLPQRNSTLQRTKDQCKSKSEESDVKEDHDNDNKMHQYTQHASNKKPRKKNGSNNNHQSEYVKKEN